MEVVLIGTGNVAHVLGKKIKQAGHTIVEVAGRNEHKVLPLAEALQAKGINDWKRICQKADIYIIAVTDDALWTIRNELEIGNGIVVHTAGSVPRQVLQGLGKNHGILYPLQSLRSDRAEMPEIPFLVDADTEDALQLIHGFATTLSPRVDQADDHKRMKLHIGAVLCNNFANHLFTLTAAFCKQEQLDFELLLPLIEETASRLKQYPPAAMQTGPAIRNDRETLTKQENYLEKFPEIRKIYELFTKSIRHFHATKS